MMTNDVFDRLESDVRYYCRRIPATLHSAAGSTIWDEEGRSYVDLLSACGALNYGHANPHLKAAAISFLMADGVAAALDFHTTTKRGFMEAFEARILRPRRLNYRMQFPSPSGTNCVEAALKLSRKYTGRTNVVAFTNGFHGVSLGALGATGSSAARRSSSVLLNGITRLPFDGYLGSSVAELDRFEAMASDPSGGIEPVAAFIVECVQGEGGLNVASADWLGRLSQICRRLGSLLIVDEIQTGCGRTGPFFAFEHSGIEPDIVCLAKSISGYGFPMSLLLMKPELDVWKPGEHNGTFRGNSIAFATAQAALELWSDDFVDGVAVRASMIDDWVTDLQDRFPGQLEARGVGMMRGLKFNEPEKADLAVRMACSAGIVMEGCGPYDEVLKLMPALNIDIDVLREALARLTGIVEHVLRDDLSRRPMLDAGITRLERDEASLDPGDDGGHAVVSA